MPIAADAAIEITAFDWVPDFARGFVRDLRPRWACEEAGLAYRERLISAADRPRWYYAEQPWGQVPFLRDGPVDGGGVTLFESGAILLHLGEKHAALLPAAGCATAQARADVLSWTLAALNSVEPLILELTRVTVFARNEEWARLREPSLTRDIDRRLRRLADALGDREWLARDFSIADIAMATVLREVDGKPVLAAHPALTAYVARATARPAFTRAMAAQLAAFRDRQPQGETA